MLGMANGLSTKKHLEPDCEKGPPGETVSYLIL